MSEAEFPLTPFEQKVLDRLDSMSGAIAQLAQAVNHTGMQVDWVTEQAKGIFGMLGSPQAAAMLPGLMGGMANATEG